MHLGVWYVVVHVTLFCMWQYVPEFASIKLTSRNCILTQRRCSSTYREYLFLVSILNASMRAYCATP